MKRATITTATTITAMKKWPKPKAHAVRLEGSPRRPHPPGRLEKERGTDESTCRPPLFDIVCPHVVPQNDLCSASGAGFGRHAAPKTHTISSSLFLTFLPLLTIYYLLSEQNMRFKVASPWHLPNVPDQQQRGPSRHAPPSTSMLSKEETTRGMTTATTAEMRTGTGTGTGTRSSSVVARMRVTMTPVS